jgi:hypothetical protein
MTVLLLFLLEVLRQTYSKMTIRSTHHHHQGAAVALRQLTTTTTTFDGEQLARRFFASELLTRSKVDSFDSPVRHLLLSAIHFRKRYGRQLFRLRIPDRLLSKEPACGFRASYFVHTSGEKDQVSRL